MVTGVREQEMLDLQVQRSDTPRYCPTEKWLGVDSCHKICVIYTGLGPLAKLQEWEQ